MNKGAYWVRVFLKSIAMAIAGLLASILTFGNNNLSGKVVSVIDGNTVEVMTTENDTVRIIFHGIDCPEIDQDYGEKARRHLEKMILEKNVTIDIQGKDRWGNRLAIILINGEIDPRLEMLEQGLAWTAERNPISELESLREKAEEKNKGLWREQNPTPPWVFRRQQTMMQPKSSS